VTSKPKNYRELEKSIHTDLQDRLTYGKYLHLDEVLKFTAQLASLVKGGPSVTEALYDGLRQALAMGFRPGAKQTVIVIGDAI